MIRVAERQRVPLLCSLDINVPTEMHPIKPQFYNLQPFAALCQSRERVSLRNTSGGVFRPPDHANPAGLVGPLRCDGKERPLDTAAVAGFNALCAKSRAAFAVLSFFLLNSSRQVA